MSIWLVLTFTLAANSPTTCVKDNLVVKYNPSYLLIAIYNLYLLITIPHHHTSSLYLITIPHHHTSSPNLITIPHHHTSSPYLITIPHHHTSSPNLQTSSAARKSRFLNTVILLLLMLSLKNYQQSVSKHHPASADPPHSKRQVEHRQQIALSRSVRHLVLTGLSPELARVSEKEKSGVVSIPAPWTMTATIHPQCRVLSLPLQAARR